MKLRYAGLPISAWLLLSASFGYGGEIFVDAAASDGGDGSSDHPFKTIQKAVDLARPGDTVTVHKGTYPEQINLRHGGTADKPIIIRADPIHSVTVDGADPLTGFEEDTVHQANDQSKVWVYRAYHSPYFPMGNAYNLRSDWIKEGDVGKQQVELISRNDMVWLDGQFLDEVDTPDQLRVGTFWVDRQSGGLHVPLVATDTPGNHLIEAAQRGTLLQGLHASFIHLRGFHFTRVAGANQTPVVRVGDFGTEGWVVEDNIADWGTWNGFGFYGKNNQILRNIAAHNGDEGMSGILHDTLLDGNSSLYNNWKGIRDTYESGGGKFTECDHLTVRHHLAAYNRGPGLWFDINNTNIIVEKSRFHDNKYAGLFMEIAPGPTELRENVSWANQGGGIVIGESMNVTIENNILANNWSGIDLRNLQDRHGKYGGWDPHSTEPMWQISDITIRNNILSKNLWAAISGSNYYFDPVKERITSDNNIIWASNLFYWQIPDPKGPDANVPKPAQAYATIDNHWVMNNIYSSSKFGGLEQHSVWKDPKFVNDDMYQFPDPKPVTSVTSNP